MAKLKILFVSANSIPGAVLKVDAEYRAVRGRLRGKPNCDIRHCPSTTLEDVIDEIEAYKPNIIHFSAHGSPSEEIVLNNDDGKPKSVPTRALEQLFKTMKGNIRVVVMNSCFSARQARPIAKFVDCVVGVKLTLADEIAIKFSPRFYESLALGKSVALAYDMAMISVYSERPGEQEVPRLFLGKVLPGRLILVSGRAKRKPDRNTAASPRDTLLPSLPHNYVPRADVLDSIRQAVLGTHSGYSLALTALHGMGGIGKTVLAKALCHDSAIQQAFPDGIIWIEVGKESQTDPAKRLHSALQVLDKDYEPRGYPTQEHCEQRFRTLIKDKAALIVLDDVWEVLDVKPFVAESARSRLLLTTRNSSIAAGVGAHTHPVDLLTIEQSRQVLSRSSEIPVSQLPTQANDLVRQCGELPLALAMVGAGLRGKPSVAWQHKLELLRSADLDKIRAQFPDYSQTNLLRVIQVSVDALEGELKERYLALAVLLEDMAAHPPVQRVLWGCDEAEAYDTAEQLVTLSLAQFEGAIGAIKLHDLQLDYLRAQFGDNEALKLIHGSIKLAYHVIIKDPWQFASQVVGRLLGYEDEPTIKHFTTSLRRTVPFSWILPLSPSLTPPGGSLIQTLEGHLDQVRSVAVYSDRVVSASDDKTLREWDLATGSTLHTYSGHTLPVNSVAVYAEGTRAISASHDATLKVWDTQTATVLRTLSGHTRWVYAVAVYPDGKRAISASSDKTLKVWDLHAWAEVRTLSGHTGWVMAVAVYAGGSRAISASSDGTLKVWDLCAWAELCTLRGHTDWVVGVVVNEDGSRAISASRDRTVRVWDLNAGTELRRLEGHAGKVNGVAVYANGKRAVSAASDKTVKIWDVNTGTELLSLPGHTDSVNAVVVTQDGRRAISASDDKTLKEWNLETSRFLRVLGGHKSRIRALASCSDRGWVISASDDRTLKVWNVATATELHTLRGHSGSVRCVVADAEGKRAVSGCDDKTLKVWNLETGTELNCLTGHTSSVRAVEMYLDNSRAVSASDDSSLKVWDLERGIALYTLSGHLSRVIGVAVYARGTRAVSASHDGTLRVWDLETGEKLHTLKGHESLVRAVVVCTDGRRAISASYDLTLKAWDLEEGVELFTLKGHENWVRAVAVYANDKRAVSASHDGTLKVWDLDLGIEIFTLQGHKDWVTTVTVCADGKRAVSTSRDNTARFWDLDSGEAITAFSADGSVWPCTVSGDTAVVGDELGCVHFLRLVEQRSPHSPHEGG